MTKKAKRYVGSPELRDGYARVAKELMYALARATLTKDEHSILFAIMAKTYGWGKTHDWISTSTLEKITGIRRPHCSRAVSGLVAKGVVTRRMDGPRLVLAIQKRYGLWTCLRDGEVFADDTPALPEPVAEGLPIPVQGSTNSGSSPSTNSGRQQKKNTTEEELTEDVVINARAREGPAVTLIDSDVHGALNPHVLFWNDELLRLYAELLTRHRKENLLLAITEGVKSNIPPGGFYRYVEQTLLKQESQGYRWQRRQAPDRGSRAQTLMTAADIPAGATGDGYATFD